LVEPSFHGQLISYSHDFPVSVPPLCPPLSSPLSPFLLFFLRPPPPERWKEGVVPYFYPPLQFSFPPKVLIPFFDLKYLNGNPVIRPLFPYLRPFFFHPLGRRPGKLSRPSFFKSPSFFFFFFFQPMVLIPHDPPFSFPIAFGGAEFKCFPFHLFFSFFFRPKVPFFPSEVGGSFEVVFSRNPLFLLRLCAP